jgi:hypothetical protein
VNKEEFIELTGENPEDMLGPDWENELETMEELKSIEYPTFESIENKEFTG